MATYSRHHHKNLLRERRRERKDYDQSKIHWKKEILQQTKYEKKQWLDIYDDKSHSSALFLFFLHMTLVL